MKLLILAVVGVVVWLLVEGNRATPSQSTGPADGGTGNDALVNLEQSIFQFEGGGKPGATNSWNNNPGNVGGGQTVFSDIGDGWDALTNLITSKAQSNPTWTLQNFFNNYLGNDPNDSSTTAQGNPVAYANYAANFMGVNTDDTLSSILNGGN